MIYFFIYIFLEIYITIEIGGYIGGFYSILEIIGSFFLGVFFIKLVQVSIIETLTSAMQNGMNKKNFLLNNIISLIGCILLILPGFLSDFIGILLQLSIIERIIMYHLGINKKDKDNEIIDIECVDIDEPISKLKHK